MEVGSDEAVRGEVCGQDGEELHEPGRDVLWQGEIRGERQAMTDAAEHL